MAVKARERYRVDLIGLQAACEANYARLMRLLPDMRHTPEARRIAVTHGDQMLGVLALEVLQACPYTTTLQVRQEHSLPWLPVPPTLTHTIQARGTRKAVVTAVASRSTRRLPRGPRCSHRMSTPMCVP